MSLYNGPLNKSLYTQQLELIAKCLIQALDKIQLEIQKDNQTDSLIFKLNIEGCIINLSDLFKKVDFSHLHMNESDSKSYINKFKLKTPASIKDKFPNLTEAEKITINAYTACSESFNAMLHGNKHFDHKKETIIDCIMLASGLNKIEPTTIYNMPAEIPNALLPPLRTYRGEVYMTQEIIKRRKALIDQGGGITAQFGFMSTSYQRKVSSTFSKNSLIVFEYLYGKDITKLANDPKEQEFLLLPCQLFWYNFENEGQTNVFYGKVVEPLNTNSEAPTPEEIEIFKRLLQWAIIQGIQTDFLTDHLIESLQLLRTTSPQPIPSPSNQNPSSTQNRPWQKSNSFFSKLNSIAFSRHPYKTALFVSFLVALGVSIILAHSILISFAYGIICGTVALASLAIRNRFYQKASEDQKNRHLFEQNLPTPQKAAFENGRKATHGWMPYFQSQFSTTNWIYIRDFAKGYDEELNKLNTRQNTPS